MEEMQVDNFTDILIPSVVFLFLCSTKLTLAYRRGRLELGGQKYTRSKREVHQNQIADGDNIPAICARSDLRSHFRRSGALAIRAFGLDEHLEFTMGQANRLDRFVGFQHGFDQPLLG